MVKQDGRPQILRYSVRSVCDPSARESALPNENDKYQIPACE